MTDAEISSPHTYAPNCLQVLAPTKKNLQPTAPRMDPETRTRGPNEPFKPGLKRFSLVLRLGA